VSGYLFRTRTSASMFSLAVGCRSAESMSKRMPESKVILIPSPTRSIRAFSRSRFISSACLSMWLPIRAPAVPPMVAPRMAPRAVFPWDSPMTAPTAPPTPAPMAPPFAFLLQPHPVTVVNSSIVPERMTTRVFMVPNPPSRSTP